MVLKALGLTEKKILSCTKEKFTEIKPICNQNLNSTKQGLKKLTKILIDRNISLEKFYNNI